MLVAHADWSVAAGKRWMCRARNHGAGWVVEAPCPVGDVATLLARLAVAAEGDGVVLGVDLPLGLPRAYAARLVQANFPAFLRTLARSDIFFSVCATLDQVNPARPFYPARGVAGMTRAAHAAALGLADAASLSRACDRATAERPAGAPLFWTLGANQVGRAAITAWRDMLLPALLGERPPLFWPFDGPLLSLLAPERVVLAETYPAEAMRQLGIRMTGSKRRQSDRARAAPALHAVLQRLAAHPAPELPAAIEDGLGADAAGEDRFDCLLGLLCVLAVLEGQRPDTAPEDPWIRHWEGWVLGQTAQPLVSPLPPACAP